MSFGAQVLVQVADSDVFVPLEHALACAITEIRVEQHLDKQTTFAIRFQEDYANDKPEIACGEKFCSPKGLAIVVPAEDGGGQLRCLVRGQTEQSDFDVDIGAVGSTFEVRGRDVRTRADRQCTSHCFAGKSGEILEQLLEGFGWKTAVDEGVVVYDKEDGKSFNFRGTRLDGVRDLARKNDFCFWMTYELDALGPINLVNVTAHVQASPPRPQDGGDESGAGATLSMANLAAGEDTIELRILPVGDACETVVNFKVNVDNEATESASSAAIDRSTGQKREAKDQTSNVEKTNPGGEDVSTVGGKRCPPSDAGMPPVANPLPGEDDPTQKRAICVGVPGDVDENQAMMQAAVNRASWYIRGEALTTVFKLGAVVEPHQIVQVTGGGCGVDGFYQISDVTHVINAADHWMSVRLRTNSRETA